MSTAKQGSAPKTSTRGRTRAAEATGAVFGPELFDVLGELALNNERQWFDANKARYEGHVREPALEFIRRIRPHLAKVSSQLAALDKKVGGSLMRVHRDIRFSPDKTPYKTNVGIHFRHQAGKDVHAPGIYLHLEVGQVFLGAGMWHPDKDALASLRRAIAAKPAAWKRIRNDPMFADGWSFGGDSLKRPPKGFDPEHPWIEDLKRKDFIVVRDLHPEDVLREDFVEQIGARMRQTRAFMRWQAAAIGLAF